MKKSGDITGYGQSVVVMEDEDNHSIRLDAGTATLSYDLYTCPTTGWKYFYATLPMRLIPLTQVPLDVVSEAGRA